jgi:hypothetical protein
MAVIKISDESFQAVPVFPLSGQALFPYMSLPLHIFEPRYVEMVDYALEHDKLIAIADVNPSGGAPELPPMLGAGVIVQVKKLQGGRYNILLQGITRVRLIEERPQVHSFRQARAEIIINSDEPEESLVDLDLTVRDLIVQLSEQHPKEREALLELLEHASDPLLLSELSAARLLRSLTRRRRAFGTLSPSHRLEVISEGLGELLMKGAQASGEEH